MAKELYVGNLPFSTDDDALTKHFADTGADSAMVIKDRDSGRSRGFGFVKFEDDAKADAAVESMNGKDLDGRELVVREARPRT